MTTYVLMDLGCQCGKFRLPSRSVLGSTVTARVAHAHNLQAKVTSDGNAIPTVLRWVFLGPTFFF